MKKLASKFANLPNGKLIFYGIANGYILFSKSPDNELISIESFRDQRQMEDTLKYRKVTHAGKKIHYIVNYYTGYDTFEVYNLVV